MTTLLVIARNHGPAGEDPAHPPFTPSRRRRSPRRPSRHAAGGGRDPARRGSWCWTGGPGRWLPPGFEVVPQCAGGLDERLAAAFAGCTGPAC
ncbi:hypothetical protein [Streptomyces sp. KL116D]|uniref:hypothetical protein n=1 Tax=Streptomyces sp. KL116D TaxID=3045152 RepID=UPI003557DF8F